MIVPMRIEYAVQIAGWEYEGSYSIYSFRNRRDDLEELMNGDYYACLGLDNDLTGYFCIGASARIPTVENEVYDAHMLDMGLGLKPVLCGMGRGGSFVRLGLDFARGNLRATQIRLTVAAFNSRAICVYEKAGFQRFAAVTHCMTHQPFLVMVCTISDCRNMS